MGTPSKQALTQPMLMYLCIYHLTWLSSQTEQSWEKFLGERGKEEPKRSLWLSSRDAVGRWEKVPQSQLSLQPSTSRGFVAEWPDGSLSSVQDI
ncbi:hypothetical protein L3Q82_000419 [Scortum barcoo]|uniref:Uncharacterized protein n=1 Tax=Scortum barcoo TaxID=214431 RepID=A0ACB8XAT3_9TELE|nr:hypothetical protein L3Q82_000419 [Scortum barcoo]